MKINKYRTSGKYLKKEDIDSPLAVTIREAREENVGKEGEPKKPKLIVYFEELEKGLVMNMTNLDAITDATGSDDTDEWPGTTLELYNDPNVSFGGKRIGGLRLRQPAAQPY